MKLRNKFLWAAAILLALFSGSAAAAEKMQALDNDHDGKPDTWVVPGQDGKPKAIGYDQHKDGKPDHWVYQRAGKIYKREWDRNFDGKPDFRTLEKDGKLLEKQYDDNFDGKFEKIVKTPH